MSRRNRRTRALARLARRKLKQAARRSIGAAVYGLSLTWSLAYFVLYTPLAWFATGAVMVLTAVVAAVCFFFGEE